MNIVEPGEHVGHGVFTRQIVWRPGPRAFTCGGHPRHTEFGWWGAVCVACYVDVWRFFRRP